MLKTTKRYHIVKLISAYIPLILSYCQGNLSLYFAYIIILSRISELIFRIYYHFVKKKEFIFRIYFADIQLYFAYTPLIFRIYFAYISLIRSQLSRKKCHFNTLVLRTTKCAIHFVETENLTRNLARNQEN